jgi:hypothetical protein
MTTEQPQGVTWADVPQSEIDKELAYWRKRHESVVWLVPCRYADGQPTCSGSPEFPYSNINRREYRLNSRWERNY